MKRVIATTRNEVGSNLLFNRLLQFVSVSLQLLRNDVLIDFPGTFFNSII